MAADISGDGSLDVKEFLSFSHPEEDPAMRPHVLAQVIFWSFWNIQDKIPCHVQFHDSDHHKHFREILKSASQVLKEKDTDGDGELSFQEYVGDRSQGKDKEWLISEKER